MENYLNIALGVILAFIGLVLVPLVNDYQQDEYIAQMRAMTEIHQFLDAHKDKRMVTQEDVDDLALGVNSTGNSYDVIVRRYIRVSTQNPDGTVRTLYFSNDDITTLNSGDVLTVEIKELGISPAKRLLYAVTGVDGGKFEYTASNTVR